MLIGNSPSPKELKWLPDPAIVPAARAEVWLAVGEWLYRQGRKQEATPVLRRVLAVRLPEEDDCKRLARAYLAKLHPDLRTEREDAIPARKAGGN